MYGIILLAIYGQLEIYNGAGSPIFYASYSILYYIACPIFAVLLFHLKPLRTSPIKVIQGQRYDTSLFTILFSAKIQAFSAIKRNLCIVWHH